MLILILAFSDFSILKEQEQTSQKLTPTETKSKPKIIRKAPNLSSTQN